jgi:hypothetical protein
MAARTKSIATSAAMQRLIHMTEKDATSHIFCGQRRGAAATTA